MTRPDPQAPLSLLEAVLEELLTIELTEDLDALPADLDRRPLDDSDDTDRRKRKRRPRADG